MLIDTHVLLWSACQPEKLSNKTQERVRLPGKVFVSAGSLFEIAIKERIGKLKGYVFAYDWIIQQNFGLIPIKDQHLRTYLTLTDVGNKDPYDLFLVAVALSERMPLLTADGKILSMNLPGLKLIDARR